MVAISNKWGLTIDEATVYFCMSRERLEKVLTSNDSLFLNNGAKKIVKRELTENYLNSIVDIY